MLPAPEKIEKAIGSFQNLGRLSGGDIAVVQKLRSQRGDFVLKSGGHAGMYASEAYGLRLLSAAGVAVPEVIDCCDDYLLLRYIAPGKPHEAAAGEMLARLHARAVPHFGLERDTYLATILQPNMVSQSWPDFFFRQRLDPLLKQLAPQELGLWQHFEQRVAPLVAECRSAALLHGDLWSGNLYYGASGPLFIDPACYCGDPLIDIAMAQLFGGFGEQFYAAYFSLIARRPHQSDLLRIYQLYPLLVHAHLFGGGYYRSACGVRDAFL